MIGSRSIIVVVVVAFLLVAGVGARYVIVEGRAVEEALRAGRRLRLEAEAVALRDEIASVETGVLGTLAKSWDDPALLLGAVRRLEAESPAPAGCWFVVGAGGRLLYPRERAVLRPVHDPDLSESATRALQLAEGPAARAGGTEEALQGYRRFLEEFPYPAPEPQMRPLAWLRCAQLRMQRDEPEAAAEALLRLEEELASPEAATDVALVRLYRALAAPLFADLGVHAESVRPAVDRARLRADRQAGRERFQGELRAWLAARINLEAMSGGGRGTHLSVSVAGRHRRFVLRSLLLRDAPVVVGYESDPGRIGKELLIPRLAPAGGAQPAFRLVADPAGEAGPFVPLGSDLPAFHLGLVPGRRDPVADAARTRRWLLGGLIASILLVGVLAVALVLRHARKALALARLRTEFVSGISHELRTPLALMQAILETLELGHVRDEEERAGYLRILGGECQRLSALIGNLLDYAGAERGAARYVVQETDVGELLESLFGTYRQVLESRGLAVDLEIAKGLPAVEADPEALRRALINLLDNAAKYAAGSETIAVRARRDGDRVRISVADRGPGIASADLPHLFEPFRRGAQVLEREVRGAGLGLSLVRQIVEGVGGEVTVESRVGEGATFHLLLRTAAGEAQ